MKNSIFFFLGAVLLIVSACNNIDAAFVEKVQADQSKIQESSTSIAAALKDVSNLQEQMKSAPSGLQNSTIYGYFDLVNKVEMFKQKYKGIESTYTELGTKLDELLNSYTDGDIKKEEVAKEQEAIMAQQEGIQAQIDRMSPMFNDVSAEYAKMIATWQSLPEAERQPNPVTSSSLTNGVPGANNGQPSQLAQPQTGGSLLAPPQGKKQ